MRYATIVADPPWRYSEVRSSDSTSATAPVCVICHGGKRPGRRARLCQCPEPKWATTAPTSGIPLPYPTMATTEIAALPIGSLAERHAHLYLWTTQAFLRPAFEIVKAWGFTKQTAVLVWSKRPKGVGNPFVVSAEFVIVARRGSLRFTGWHAGTVFEWPRPGDRHSAKPDAFLDLVEQISPGPYVELFARRARFGWDTWGDESLQTATLHKPAFDEESKP